MRKAFHPKKPAGSRRVASVPSGGQAGSRRMDDPERREGAGDRRWKAAALPADPGENNAAQLREANERLVVASMTAQSMAEAAKQAAAQMAFMAEHDYLTGLPNRSLLADRLAQSISLAHRHAKRAALMYLDLDHFKHVNDSLGHAIGDQLLQSAARRLQACVRNSDTVSRQGGDEFVVLLGEVEEVRDVSLIAEKMIAAMAAPHVIDGHTLHVTLSIGISLCPDDGNDVETVLRNADTALYHAKRIGRNNYQAFTPEMNAHAVARRSIEEAMHTALEHRGMRVHYQPKVSLQTGALTGVEALLRVQRADGTLLLPAQFVSVAEDCGLIVPMGRWVLLEACRQAAAWVREGLEMGQIAVNVSVVEFQSRDFLAGVQAILAETGLNPRRLELELTESGLMKDTELTMGILKVLKGLGVGIAVDDFGTGYSSLSYLRRFPIDTLKIDQSFVRDIGGNAGEAIVSAIIAMGLNLKQRVVAEGIETAEQLAFLQSRRCAEGQGYFFSAPLAAGELAAWAAAGAVSGVAAFRPGPAVA